MCIIWTGKTLFIYVVECVLRVGKSHLQQQHKKRKIDSQNLTNVCDQTHISSRQCRILQTALQNHLVVQEMLMVMSVLMAHGVGKSYSNRLTTIRLFIWVRKNIKYVMDFNFKRIKTIYGYQHTKCTTSNLGESKSDSTANWTYWSSLFLP